MTEDETPPFSDGWYCQVPGVRTPDAAWRATPGVRRLPPALVRRMARVGFLRGVLLFAASTVHPVVGAAREDPGWGTLLALRALFGRRRKLVVLQFIRHDRRHPLRHALMAWDRWAVRRAMLRGHALSRTEVECLATAYDLDEARFVYVPWCLSKRPLPALGPLPEEPTVLIAGRAYCDWDTVFAAARDAGWALHVVCGRPDLRRVRRLDEQAGRPAHSIQAEIPREEYLELLHRARVLGVVLQDRGRAAGQIRTADALASGVPLVVTDGATIRDYVEDGRTAFVVPSADAGALRAAVDRLLADDGLADSLRRNAQDAAASWTARDYLDALAAVFHGGPAALPPGAPGA